jgi:hypothetical protein
MENESPIDNVMHMAQQMTNLQYNSAKLTISWNYKGHLFAVESMNPTSVFSLMEQVKEVAKKRLEAVK